MGIARATISLPFASGLPRDLSENTFWFNIPSGDSFAFDEATDIIARLRNFYSVAPVSGGSIGQLLAPYITRLTSKITLVGVDVATGLDIGTPIFDSLDLPSSTDAGAVAYPAEVACCLSFKAQPLAGTPAASLRGRVYLGPWAPFGTAVTPEVEYSRPAGTIIGACGWAGSGLIGSGPTAGGDGLCDWIVYSRKLRTAHTVFSCYVDNEWDTQRRRGKDATSRTVWNGSGLA